VTEAPNRAGWLRRPVREPTPIPCGPGGSPSAPHHSGSGARNTAHSANAPEQPSWGRRTDRRSVRAAWSLLSQSHNSMRCPTTSLLWIALPCLPRNAGLARERGTDPLSNFAGLGVTRPALEETRYFPPTVVGDRRAEVALAPQVAKREARHDAWAETRFRQVSARVSRASCRGLLGARVDGHRRCSVCLEATASLRMAALSIALSLIVRSGSASRRTRRPPRP
jgi:hypothetical protein